MVLSGEEERRLGQATPPPPLVQIGQGGGGAPPSFLSLTSSPLLLIQQGREGVLLQVGVGLHPPHSLLAGRLSRLLPLYPGAGGTPPLLVQIGLEGEGVRPALAASPLLH